MTTIVILAVLFSLITILVYCEDADTRSNSKRHILEMQRAMQRHREEKRKRLASCTSLETASPRQIHTTHAAVSRSKRSIQNEHERHNEVRRNSFGLRDHRKSVYFDGNGAVIQLKMPDGNDSFLPRWSFTVDIWVKPEGGQNTPVNILGLYDTCSTRPNVPGYFWSVGIEPKDKSSSDRSVSFSFNIRSHKTYKPAKIVDSREYIPNVWVHIAVTYDGHMSKLYMNGAIVGKSTNTWGELFTNESISCVKLLMGGNPKTKKYFRGEIGYVNYVREALTHHEVVKSMLRSRRHERKLVLKDNFDNLNRWKPVFEIEPKHIDSTFLSDWMQHDIGLSVPHCGQTVCDDPEVIVSYSQNEQLRYRKVIRTRIINLANDDGTYPQVEREQIKLQTDVLRKAYKPYNISLKVEEIIVKNSVLRKKKILFGCEAEKIGDGTCHSECQHPLTGNDGGDCDIDYMECDKEKIGNGICDLECNRKDSTWDGGDCCLVNVVEGLTCFDPDSPNRVYMNLNEYKMALGFDNKKYLNIYFADWTMEGLVGLATFPWEHEVHSEIGGVVLKPQQFGLPGATNNLVHEIGHILGLWHTHHGITEMDCTNGCLEVEPSLELGDLCSDTNPTNENRECNDPEVEHFTCAVTKLKTTNFKNFMGYGGDDCTNHFSPQQAARMHCYLDLSHKLWLEQEGPAPVPLAPRVLATTDTSLTIAWVPPLNHGANDHEICTWCEEDKSLLQYATQAWSPASANNTGFYSAMHATGPPDSAQCEADPNAWLADPDGVMYECTTDCYLDVIFQEPVVAKRIYIWANWNSQDGIDDVILYSKENHIVHLGKIHTFCDMPFTREIFDDIQVRKMRINTNSPYVTIDAVAIQSAPNHEKCHQCKHVTYKLKRQPSFLGEETVEIDEKIFKDVNVVKGTTYKYSIISSLNGIDGLPSPVLTYEHGGPYCGDGKLGDSESCDDGNLKDGDGCSLNCKIEKFFHCSGAPSLCYNHNGDGVCEEFEARASLTDCGFFTPHNYVDQWASSVQTDPWSMNYECPVDVINGPPPLKQECKTEIDDKASWHPCGTFYSEEDYWIKAYFDKAVVAAGVIIYLGSDGMTSFNMDPNKITVTLIDEHDLNHEGGKTDVVVACRNNPVYIHMKHDLSMAFFYTKGVLIKFKNRKIAIAAVRLRSFRYLDPRGLQACAKSGHVFNPKTGQCSLHPCDIPTCEAYIMKHGSETCSGVSEGDVCKVTCNKGYKLNSDHNEVMCLDGSWATDLACEPIPCDPPVVPFAKVACLDGHVYGSKCKFECKEPAVKRGLNTAIECQWDGSWTLPTAYCDVVCLKPTLKGGKVLSPECNSTQLNVGTKCKVKCFKGYSLVESEAQRTLSRLTCTDEGLWDGAACERVQCPTPSVIYQGLYSCSKGFYYGSQCTLKCPGPGGETSVITCKHTGEWDEDFTPCRFPTGTCPEISQPEQYTLDCDRDELTIGSTCSVYCNSPEKESVASVMSIIVGKTSLISVDSIMCTGSLVWYPDPLEVHCIRSCAKDFIGDEYCDASNNRAVCEYDGGDCCASTVEGGSVQPFPSDCTTECACIDPSAEENLNKQRDENLIIKRERSNHSHERDHDTP